VIVIPGRVNTLRRTRLFAAVLALLFSAFQVTSAVSAGDTPETSRNAEFNRETPASVLFVGNSFTFYNNSIHTHLRNLLAAVDPAPREDPFLKSMTISGAVLSDHVRGLEQMLEQWDWDVVVLQGHSLEALEESSRESFRESARGLASMAAAHGARPVLFMTWAYSNRPEMTPMLDRAYSGLGRELDLTVIPVGLAFDRALDEIPGLVLRTADQKHPTLEGTYLAACVFYAALWGKSPESLDYTAGLPHDVAAALRRTAWRTVNNYDGSE
jgi:hypothetical protein